MLTKDVTEIVKKYTAGRKAKSATNNLSLLSVLSLDFYFLFRIEPMA
jgi:hypothetical protein